MTARMALQPFMTLSPSDFKAMLIDLPNMDADSITPEHRFILKNSPQKMEQLLRGSWRSASVARCALRVALRALGFPPGPYDPSPDLSQQVARKSSKFFKIPAQRNSSQLQSNNTVSELQSRIDHTNPPRCTTVARCELRSASDPDSLR